MTAGIVPDQSLEKQMSGCMSGFFHLFDRHHLLTGKRLYATKRLPPPKVVVDVQQELHKSIESPPISPPALDKPKQRRPPLSCPSPDHPSETPPILPLPLPLPLFQLKEGTTSSWKLSKEAPRLSLDSRATLDSKGSLRKSSNNFHDTGHADVDENQRRSTSVVARLMGLHSLPNSSPQLVNNAQLRRSASESRVSRDLFQYPFVDNNSFQLNQPNNSYGTKISSNAIRENASKSTTNTPQGSMDYSSRNAKKESANRGGHGPQWKQSQQRKSFFDSADFFPEPKPMVSSIYGDIEKRLRFRGIDEPLKDLDTLKHILDALQLKGLLHHSSKPSESRQIAHTNFVYDDELSPIIVLKHSTSPRRNLNFAGETSPSVNPRQQRRVSDRNMRSPTRTRNLSSPTRNESNVKRSKAVVNSKPVSVETNRKVNVSTEQRRVSPVRSPKVRSRGSGADQAITNRSPRSRRSTGEICRKEKIATFVAEDESSSISESTVSTSSQTDTERWKMEEYKEGRSLLERCDKLLHSIAEITATDLQPSPVSVLDSSFYKDDSFSPSPVMKRRIDLTVEQCIELEDEIWSPAISPAQSKSEDNSFDCDFMYISDILRVSNYLSQDSDIFLLLEKQQYIKGNDTSKISRLQRKLIFDTIIEILDRNKQLPPWKVISFSDSAASLQKIWSEFQKIRERKTGGEDYFEVICGVLKKNIAGDAINGWGDCPVEMSEAVLDIERLIFKDLVGETIRDVAAFAGKSTISVPCRKLVF